MTNRADVIPSIFVGLDVKGGCLPLLNVKLRSDVELKLRLLFISKWWVEPSHPILVSLRQSRRWIQIKSLVIFRLQDESCPEWVVHDRVGIPGRSLDLVLVQLPDDVVIGLLTGPVVRRSTQICIDGLHVPDHACVGVLMLVGEAHRVADLMDSCVDVVCDVPSNIHGPLSLGNGKNVTTHVGPGPSTLLEANSNLSINGGDFQESETNAHILPDLESLAHGLLLSFRTTPGAPAEEVVAKYSATDPFLIHIQNCPNAVWLQIIFEDSVWNLGKTAPAFLNVRHGIHKAMIMN
mmetsp:Transcript_105701/g.187991  ORF Transcript_105701/g.187991 Transcript_105701/m.187991 type:complete len:293 (-) Transcript_105701:8-886(-)